MATGPAELTPEERAELAAMERAHGFLGRALFAGRRRRHHARPAIERAAADLTRAEMTAFAAYLTGGGKDSLIDWLSQHRKEAT